MAGPPQHVPSQSPQRTVQVREEFTEHAGPIPDPENLRKYDALITNGAERIMAMAEREQGHRHRMEGLLVMGGFSAQVIGSGVAACVALSFIAMAFWLFREGKDGAAFVSMLAPLAGLCGVLVWRVRKKPD